MTEEEIDIIKNPSGGLSLEKLLEGYKKSQLLEMGESLACTLPKSWTKTKMIQTLTHRIIQQAQTIYSEVLEQVIDTLPDREQNMYYLNSLSDIRSLAPLIRKGFFFAAESEKDYIFIIPSEVIDAVDFAEKAEDPTVSGEGTEAEVDIETVSEPDPHQAVYALTKWKNQLISIYGSYSSAHLQSIWNRYYPEELSIEEIEDLLAD